jgi:hypothetical protein
MRYDEHSLLPFPGAAVVHGALTRDGQDFAAPDRQSIRLKKIVAATKRAIGSIAFLMLMYLTLSRPHREIVSSDEY